MGGGQLMVGVSQNLVTSIPRVSTFTGLPDGWSVTASFGSGPVDLQVYVICAK